MDSLSFVTSYGEGATASAIASKQDGKNVLLSKVSRLIIWNTEASTVEPLLVTRDGAVATREGKTVDRGVAALSTTIEESGETSKIFVVPTALLSNGDLMVSNGYSNKCFLYGLFEEVFGSNIGIYGTRSVDFASGTVENLTQRASIIYTVLLVLIPVLLMAVGVVIIIRRKNR